MELLTIPQTSQPLSPMSQESQCPSSMSQCLIADNPLNSFDAPPSTPNPQRQNVGPTLAVGLVRVGLLSQMSHVPNVTCPKCPKGSQSQMSLVPNVSCPKCLLSQMSHVPNVTCPKYHKSQSLITEIASPPLFPSFSEDAFAIFLSGFIFILKLFPALERLCVCKAVFWNGSVCINNCVHFSNLRVSS